MLYVVPVTVPAGTPVESPVEAYVEIEEEYITRIDVQFPAGVRNEVYVAIFYGEMQIFPSTKGTWVTGEAETVSAEVKIWLPDKPTRLTIKAISPNADYPHNILVRIYTADSLDVEWTRYIAWLVKYLYARGI